MAGCTGPQAPAQTGSNVTAPDGGLCVYVCGRPRANVSWATCGPWRELYRSDQLGDREAETSPTKWHSEPYGFEIIGRVRILTLMPCGLYIWLAVSPSLYPPV